MDTKFRRGKLSNIWLQFFSRLVPLFTLFIIAIYTISFFLALEHHRQDIRQIFTMEANLYSDELGKFIRAGNKRTLKRRLAALAKNKLIEYVFIEKEGIVYAQAPDVKLPKARYGKHSLLAKALAVQEFEDPKNRIFIDIAAPIKGTDAILHLLLSRSIVDQHVISTLWIAFLFGIVTILLACLLSYRFSRWANSEVEHLTSKLYEERQQLLSIFESISEIIYVVDPCTYKIIFANQALRDILNEDVIGGYCYKKLHGRDMPCKNCINGAVLKNNHRPYQREYFNSRIGQHLLVTSKLIKWPDGRDVKFELAINITDRKRAERQLKESEERYRSLVTTSIDGVVSVNEDMKIILWNPAAETIFGYTKEEMLGQSVLKIVPEIFRRAKQNGFAKFAQNGTGLLLGQVVQLDGLRKDGKEIPIELSVSATRHENSYVATAIIRDITERKKMEEELKNREKKYRTLFNASIDAFLLTTVDGYIADCNVTACKMFGYTSKELIKLKTKDIFEEELNIDLPILSCELDSSDNLPFEIKGRRKDGSLFPVEIKARPITILEKQMIIINARDITAQKEAEKEKADIQEQMRRAQRLEAIGTLAGGIAHDFNNLLTVINGHCEIAMYKTEKCPQLEQDIGLIQKAASRAGQLTAQLLAFGRKQIFEPRIVNVNQIITDLNKMLYRLISEDIQLESILSEDIPCILADPTQIEQILINLVVNARDAIHEVDDTETEKKIVIETFSITLDEAYVSLHVGSRIGPHVVISVSDTGIGMDPNIQKRIFDPFFSTKDIGQGTGLGLATVYGIVKQNRGCIYVYSEPGKGSTFKLYWPAVAGNPMSPPTKHTDSPLTGTEKILVVEDDDMVRNFIASSLNDQGYKVITASDGSAALKLINTQDFQIDLLITDLIMPNMSGKQLAAKIKEICPQCAILYISGYAANYIVHCGMLEAGINFIQKPFSIQKLSEKIREILTNQTRE